MEIRNVVRSIADVVKNPDTYVIGAHLAYSAPRQPIVTARAVYGIAKRAYSGSTRLDPVSSRVSRFDYDRSTEW